MFKKILSLVLIICFLNSFIFNLSYAREEKTTMAVADLTVSKEVLGVDGGLLADFVVEELVALKKFSVVDRKAMKDILVEQGFQASGCTETECAVQIGQILSVQKMVIGNISKLADTYYLTLRLIDVEKAEIEIAKSIEFSSIKELKSKIKELVLIAFTGKPEIKITKPEIEKETVLKVDSEPKGAKVYLEDKKIGLTPLEYIPQEEDFGAKIIKVKKEGYKDYEKKEIISEGKEIKLLAKLSILKKEEVKEVSAPKKKKKKSNFTIILLGILLVGGIAAAGGGGGDGGAPSTPTATTDVNITVSW